MGPIPEDLIAFLLFGAFVLVQMLRNWRRNKRRVPVEPAATVPTETQTPAEAEALVPLPWTPTVVEGPRQKPPAAAQPVLSSQRAQARLFARRTLMGDRRSLQDAIVVATILGPCRAQRPRDME